MQELLDQMTQRALRRADGKRRETLFPRLGIGVVWPHTQPAMTMCAAGVCLVLQGDKQMLVGDKTLHYRAGSCFASLIELPSTRWIFGKTSDKPYVATSLTLDCDLISSVLADLPSPSVGKAVAGFGVQPVSRALIEAWDRLLALLDTPEDIAFLAPLRERELLYRLLESPHGPLLRQIARADGQITRIRRAIDWIRDHLSEPLVVTTLAEIAGMSVASFNRNFRAATSTSPLQYQKTLRLQEARRLLSVNADATRAAYAVGYESTSQFSREYSRLFGRPPKQDAAFHHGRVSEMSL